MNQISGMIARQVSDATNARVVTPLPVAPIAPPVPVKSTYANHGGLSAAAQEALLSCGTNRQGAKPAPRTPREALEELRDLGFLGDGWGLTRRGTIKRQILSEDQLDALFG